MMRFLRRYGVRIGIGAVLLAALFGVLLVWTPYQRERRIANEFEAAGGKVRWEYCGPDWVVPSIRSRVPFAYRVSYVDLDRQRIPAETLSGLESLSNLQDFCAHHDGFDDAACEHLKNRTRLVSLYLTKTSITDAGMAHLKDLDNLGVLDLGRTQITDTGLKYLQGKSRLSALFLSFTKVSGAGMDYLQDLPRLNMLELSGVEIGEAGLEKVGRMTQVQTLFLCETKVDDAGLMKLEGLHGLKLLGLSGTDTTPEGRARLREKLPNCEITPEP